MRRRNPIEMSRFVCGAFLAAAALGARAERATFDGEPWASRQLFLGATSPSPPSLQPPSVTGSPGAEHPNGQQGTDCDGRGPGHPLPPPAASPSSLRAGTGICTTTCFFESEAECFDGGPSSEFPRCAYGTDCVDCGARIASPPPPPHSAGMVHTNNCLSGGPGSKLATCAVGTDCIDCGPRVFMPSPPPRPPAGHLAPSLPPSSCSNPCFYASNADCDHGGFGCLICAYGTDYTSCREHPPSRHEQTSRRHERPPGRAVVSTSCAVASTSCAIASTSCTVTTRSVASNTRGRAVAGPTRAVASTAHAVSTYCVVMDTIRAVTSTSRAGMGTIVSIESALMGIRRAVVSNSHAVGSTNRAVMTTLRAEHIPQRTLLVWCLLSFWRGLLSFWRLLAFRWRLLMFWTAAAFSIHGSPRQLVLWGCMLMRSLMAWLHRFAKPLCTRHRPREEHGLHVALTLLALYSMLPCSKASDAHRLYSVQPVPSHRRELQTAVSTSAGLIGALANTTVSHIVLAPGTYYLSAELSITRSVILEAAMSGTVVLNAQASSSSQRRVLLIDPGSSGVVQLIRLNITGGYIDSVCALRSSKVPIAPMGRLLTCLPRLTLAQLRTLRSTTEGTCHIETLQISHRSQHDSRVACCLQGGGVYVSSGRVMITSSSIYRNTAYDVRAHVPKFPSP
jgi:hypothetical protein